MCVHKLFVEQLMASSIQYPVKSKGKFGIIKEITHKLKFDPKGKGEVVDWSGSQLNYDADVKELKDTFTLGGVGEDTGENSRIGHDLTNDSEQNSFKNFMDEFCNRENETTPGFIMFFLMSHGFENGDFLLSSNGINGVSKERCCVRNGNKKMHSYDGECFATLE